MIIVFEGLPEVYVNERYDMPMVRVHLPSGTGTVEIAMTESQSNSLETLLGNARRNLVTATGKVLLD